MFCCKVCEGTLSPRHKIVATYCGHIFHHDCLNYYFINRTVTCPSCEKSLKKVNPISPSFAPGYAILPLEPYEGNNTRQVNRDKKDVEFKTVMLQENAILKGKLKRAVQTLLTKQIHVNYEEESISTVLNHPDDDQLRKRLHNEKFSNDIFIGTLDMELLKVNDEILEHNSNDEIFFRITRSKQREYLTWRNKAQSWLAKMGKAWHRLLEAETFFNPDDYLKQLRQFSTKIYQQSEIIEMAKQAATMNIIIGNPTGTKIKEIQTEMNSLIDGFSVMMESIMNKIQSLENLSGEPTLEQPDILMVPATHSDVINCESQQSTDTGIRDEAYIERSREINISEERTNVALYPKQKNNHFQCVLMQLEKCENGEIEISQEPVFV